MELAHPNLPDFLIRTVNGKYTYLYPYDGKSTKSKASRAAGKIEGGGPTGRIIWSKDFINSYPELLAYEVYRQEVNTQGAVQVGVYQLVFTAKTSFNQCSNKFLKAGATWLLDTLLSETNLIKAINNNLPASKLLTLSYFVLLYKTLDFNNLLRFVATTRVPYLNPFTPQEANLLLSKITKDQERAFFKELTLKSSYAPHYYLLEHAHPLTKERFFSLINANTGELFAADSTTRSITELINKYSCVLPHGQAPQTEPTQELNYIFSKPQLSLQSHLSSDFALQNLPELEELHVQSIPKVIPKDSVQKPDLIVIIRVHDHLLLTLRTLVRSGKDFVISLGKLPAAFEPLINHYSTQLSKLDNLPSNGPQRFNVCAKLDWHGQVIYLHLQLDLFALYQQLTQSMSKLSYHYSASDALDDDEIEMILAIKDDIDYLQEQATFVGKDKLQSQVECLIARLIIKLFNKGHSAVSVVLTSQGIEQTKEALHLNNLVRSQVNYSNLLLAVPQTHKKYELLMTIVMSLHHRVQIKAYEGGLNVLETLNLLPSLKAQRHYQDLYYCAIPFIEQLALEKLNLFVPTHEHISNVKSDAQVNFEMPVS